VGWNGRWLEVELVEEGAEEAQLDLCQYTYYERMVRFEASKTVSDVGENWTTRDAPERTIGRKTYMPHKWHILQIRQREQNSYDSPYAARSIVT
jgi:hypothetical protein